MAMFHGVSALLIAAIACIGTHEVKAEEIVVTNYGVTANSFPYIVAFEKKFFQKAGADVTGIVTTEGGGTTIRNMIGGNLPYGDSSFAAVVQAFQQGADIRIIAATNNTVGELYLGMKPELGAKTLADITGRRLGYTQPKSTTQAVTQVIIDVAGFKQNEVQTLRTGGAGQTIVALENNLIDGALIQEPLWSQHKSEYQEILAAADILPPMAENFALTTTAAMKTKGDFIRGVLLGRKMAIDFMRSNPDESAEIIAKKFDMKPAVIKTALLNMLTPRKGVPYYGNGDFLRPAIDNMAKALIAVGGIDAIPDWSKLIDERFITDELKTKN